MGVSVCPQLNLWTIHNKFTQLTVIAAVHHSVMLVKLMHTLKTWTMMSNHHKLCIMLFSDHKFNISQCFFVPLSSILRTKSSIVALTIAYNAEVVHHITDSMYRKWIPSVHISPKSSTNECNIVNGDCIHF